MNRDGQMSQILKTEYAQFASKLKPVAFGDGMPASAKWVREGILATIEKKKVVKKAAPAKKTTAKKVVTKKPSAKKVTKKAVTSKTVKKANRK